MSVVKLLRRIEEGSRKEYEELLASLKERKVTVILFGSRASGRHSLLSDYDLLVIYEDEPVRARGLAVNVFNVKRSELREKLSSPLVVSALLGGQVILDNLDLTQELKGLSEELRKRGAKLGGDRIVLPRVV